MTILSLPALFRSLFSWFSELRIATPMVQLDFGPTRYCNLGAWPHSATVTPCSGRRGNRKQGPLLALSGHEQRRVQCRFRG